MGRQRGLRACAMIGVQRCTGSCRVVRVFFALPLPLSALAECLPAVVIVALGHLFFGAGGPSPPWRFATSFSCTFPSRQT